MGEIWGNVRLGLSPMSIVAAFIAMVLLSIGSFAMAFILVPVMAIAGAIGAIIVGLILFIVYLLLAAFTTNLLNIVAVQNISTRKINLGVAFSRAIKRIKTTFIGVLLVIILSAAVLLVFGIIGAVIGMIVGGGVTSALGSAAGAADPVTGALLASMGGLIVGAIFAMLGFYAVALAFLPSFSSFSAFLANEDLGAVASVKKALHVSKIMWPKGFGIAIGTMFVIYLFLMILYVLMFVLTIIHPILGLIGVLLVGVGYLALMSIGAHIGARIYIDYKKMMQEPMAAGAPQPMHGEARPSSEVPLPSKGIMRRNRPHQKTPVEVLQSSQPANIPNPRRVVVQKRVADARATGSMMHPLTADEQHQVEKLVELLKDKSNDYSKEDLVIVMREKGYNEKVAAEVLKRLRKK